MEAHPASTDAGALRRQLVDSAAAMVPLLKSNAAKTESLRRLPEENLAAMDRAGLFRLRSPQRFGGYEADLRTYVDVVAELGRGCGSTSWIAFISDATSWITSLFPDEVQSEIFEGNPDCRFIGLLEPSAGTRPVEGGHVVSGRWPFASNSLHAQWGLLAVPIMDAGGAVTDQAVNLIPMSDLSVEDTWHVAGMRGTGSNTVIADDVFVPSRRILSLRRLLANDFPRRSRDEPVYRENFVLTAILMVIPPILGVARGALDHAIEVLGRGKKIYYTFYGDSRQAPTTQLQLARAATLVENAFLLVRHWAEEICAAARAGAELDLLTRARARMEFCHAVRCCREAMGILLDLCGAGSFADASPMQRMWRDLEMASRHALINPDMAQEIYGRALLGIEQQMTPLV